MNSNLPQPSGRSLNPCMPARSRSRPSPSAAAAQKFAEAARFDPKFAELQFRWAQCLLSETNLPAAREHFQTACDVDALPFRADTRVNGMIRTLATNLAGNNFVLCDAETALMGASPDGIAGDESFFEHVHFNFDGNYRLAKVWAENIGRCYPRNHPAQAAADWARRDVCERAIGLSDWNRMFVYSSVVSRMGQPPLAMHFNNAARVEVLQQQMTVLRGRMNQTNAVAAAADFATAVAQRPPTAFSMKITRTFSNRLGTTKARWRNT